MKTRANINHIVFVIKATMNNDDDDAFLHMYIDEQLKSKESVNQPETSTVRHVLVWFRTQFFKSCIPSDCCYSCHTVRDKCNFSKGC